MNTRNKAQRSFRLNDLSALNPSLWANEAILQLQPLMIIGNMINRDFDTKVARFGDLVNAWVPGNFAFKRKGALLENVQTQDATGSTIQVACDQWPHVSFVIADGEEDRSFLDLVEALLTPAVNALAQGIDLLIAGRILSFLSNNAGQLGGVTSSNVYDYMLDTKQVMDSNNVPSQGRALLVSGNTETAGLKNTLFVQANTRGDGGTALTNAVLGRVAGFDTYRVPAVPSITSGQQTVTNLTTAAVAAGGTVIPFTTNTTGFAAGQWITIAGDMIPHQIVSISSLNVTVTPALKRAVANGAAITGLVSAAVNLVAGYAGTTTSPHVIGYAKEIAIDGITVAPRIGQFVTFGTSTTKYSIIGVTTLTPGSDYGIMLDRPLEATAANNVTVNFGPIGEYNFAFLKNAFTFINRPLPQPRTGTGTISRVVSDPRGKISLRVTISYDPLAQGHRVTIDTLCGTGVLDGNLGAVMFG